MDSDKSQVDTHRNLIEGRKCPRCQHELKCTDDFKDYDGKGFGLYFVCDGCGYFSQEHYPNADLANEAYEKLIERLKSFNFRPLEMLENAWLKDFVLYARLVNVLFSDAEIASFNECLEANEVGKALQVLRDRIDIEFGKTTNANQPLEGTER